MTGSFDWSNQVLDSLWWVAWVFVLVVAGSAAAAWLLARFTGWGRQVARLALPYFTPRGPGQSWRPILTVLLMLLLTVAAVRMSVLFTYVNNGIYTAFQETSPTAFTSNLMIFGVLAVIHVLRALFEYFIVNMFNLRWREGLNEHLLDDWLDGQAYARGDYAAEPVDNPDQRIQEDITTFVTTTQSLAVGAVNAMVSLVTFSVILWQLSGPLTLLGVEIPRAMIFITYLYVIVATVIAFRIGHPLVWLNFFNERYNAVYRYALIRVRDNAENVALYRGERVERAALTARFGAIIDNFWKLVFRSVKFQGFNLSVNQLSIVFPFVVQAPRFFSGGLKLGDLVQTASAFMNVHDSLSFFRTSYDTFAGYRATLDRLTGLLDVDAEARALPSVPVEDLTGEPGSGLRIRDLTVRRPDGRELVSGLDLDLASGASLVVKGGSGTGRSSLLRSIAGFWPYAEGTVARPPAGRSLFLSQQPYLPFGTLRDALAYPDGPDSVSEDRAREALRQVFLGHLVDQLDQDQAWWRILSPGEQQRIGFARILLARPDTVFLDESTSSVDEGLEHALYSLVRERLPDCTIFSIGHRSTLDPLHTHHLELLPGGRWTLDVPVS